MNYKKGAFPYHNDSYNIQLNNQIYKRLADKLLENCNVEVLNEKVTYI